LQNGDALSGYAEGEYPCSFDCFLPSVGCTLAAFSTNFKGVFDELLAECRGRISTVQTQVDSALAAVQAVRALCSAGLARSARL
jgi:hypothetical protein